MGYFMAAHIYIVQLGDFMGYCWDFMAWNTVARLCLSGG